MGVTIKNSRTGEIVAQARQCTSFYDTHIQSNGPVQLVEVPLSFYDAAKSGDECIVGTLDPPDEVRFKGKLAVFLEYNSHCISSYYDNLAAVQRVHQAGGIGIIYLNKDPGFPGLWHDLDGNSKEYKEWYEHMGFNNSLPVMHCAHDVMDQNMTKLIPAWITAMHDAPANKVETSPYYNQSLTVTITEDINYWVRDMQTGFNMYFFLMKIVFPILSFGVMCLAINTMRKRHVLVKSWFTIQNIALILEAMSLALIGIYLAVDGFYATPYNAMTQWRSAMTGALYFVSAATTLIVGLNFQAVRFWIAKSETIKISLAEKLKWIIVGVAVIFVGFEVAGTFLREISWEVGLYFNFFLTFVLFCCVWWFAWEVKGFVKVLAGANRTQKNSTVNQMVVHTTKWTAALVVLIVLALVCFFVSVGNPYLFTPGYWKVYFPSLWFSRILSSLCKVILLSPLPRKDSNRKYTPTGGTHANAVAPVSVAAGAGSAIISSVSDTT